MYEHQPATSALGHGAASLPGAALWGDRVCRDPSPPSLGSPWEPPRANRDTSHPTTIRESGGPSPTLVLLLYFAGYQHTETQFAQLSISDTGNPVGAPPGSNIPPGSDILLSHCAAPHIQAVGD